MDWTSVGCNDHSDLDPSLHKNTRGSSKIYTMHTHSIIYLFIHYNIGFWGFYDGVVLLSTTDSDIINQSRIYGISYSNLVQTLSVITICLLPHANISKKVAYLLIVIFSYAAFVTLKECRLLPLYCLYCTLYM